MENNVPPSDNNDNRDYNPDGMGNGNLSEENMEDVALHDKRPSLGGGRSRTIALISTLVVVGGYVAYGMFFPEEKKEGVDVLGGEKGLSEKVAEKERIETSAESSLPALPTPPVVQLPPPPAQIPSPIFAAPPSLPPSLPSISKGSSGGQPPAPPVLPTTITPTGSTPLSSGDIPPPPPPPLPSSTTALPAPPVPVPPRPEISGIGAAKSTDKDVQKRLRSNMLVIDGGKKGGQAKTGQTFTGGDANRAFSENIIQATTADKAIATGLNNLNMTIAQGKIINAVLEVAVNTDLPGTLRAIVSRDTYAETGRDVLIPKGSRLIGTYNTGILRGQKRVMVVWTRLIRPDGIDIMIGSPGVDDLGRGGVEGIVDNKFSEIFSTAILTTSLTVAAAYAVEEIFPSNGTTTTSPEGYTTTTNTPATQAAAQAVTDFSTTAKDVVKTLIDVRPTITIDQGTRVNVFVNRDLTFPRNLGEGLFIQ